MRVFSFDAFAKLGQENPSDPIPPKPEDLCTIMYTSGTTDKPKVGITQCSAPRAAEMLNTHKSCTTQLSMTMSAVCHAGCICPSKRPAPQDWPVSCYGASRITQVHSRHLKDIHNVCIATLLSYMHRCQTKGSISTRMSS